MHRITSLFAVLMVAAITGAAAQPSTQPQGEPMDTPEFRITQVAMAVKNLEPTVNFYQKVFNTTFKPFEVMGHKLYSGKLLGMDFVLTSNELAGVQAEQSRHQFDVAVADMESALKRVVESGGTIREEERQNGTRTATIVDPDGNTIIFIGKE